MTADSVSVVIDKDNIAMVTLDRTKALNSFDRAQVEAFNRVLDGLKVEHEKAREETDAEHQKQVDALQDCDPLSQKVGILENSAVLCSTAFVNQKLLVCHVLGARY